VNPTVLSTTKFKAHAAIKRSAEASQDDAERMTAMPARATAMPAVRMASVESPSCPVPGPSLRLHQQTPAKMGGPSQRDVQRQPLECHGCRRSSRRGTEREPAKGDQPKKGEEGIGPREIEAPTLAARQARGRTRQ